MGYFLFVVWVITHWQLAINKTKEKLFAKDLNVQKWLLRRIIDTHNLNHDKTF